MSLPPEPPSPDPAGPDALDLRAAEYVLGTLTTDEHTRVQGELAADPALARAVHAWQDRLLPLASRVAPVEAPGRVWDAIAQRTSSPASGNTAAAARWWRRLGLWQGLAGASTALALVLALRMAGGGMPGSTPAPTTARYLAVLTTPQQQAGWVVELVSADRLRMVPVGPQPAAMDDRSYQLWTKPTGAARPTSLGLVEPGQTVHIPRAALPAVEAGQLFEITLEPKGGSPTGGPTGPIQALGRMVIL